MSDAYDTLVNLTEDEITLYSSAPEVEKHIVIGADRFITVPNELKRIAVQFDHNVETVTFDCPRYWDDHDLSTMQIYINYVLPNKEAGSYTAENIVSEDNVIHFDWIISNIITQLKGPIIFLVCAKTVDDEGNETLHWNSELNSDMYISEGLEGGVQYAIDMYPDIITQLLSRMTSVEQVKPLAEAAATSAAISATEAKASETAANEILEQVTAQKQICKDAAASASIFASNASSAAASQVVTKADAIIRSGDGESIIITDSSDDPLRGLRIMGKTEQAVTTGKNLLNIPEVLTINNTYNVSVSIPAGTYIFSFSDEQHAGSEIPYFRFYDNDVWVVFNKSNKSQTVVLSQDETNVYIYTNGMSASNSENIEATLKQIMLSVDGGSYEPYSEGVSSPSPEYPQEMYDRVNPNITITGKNFFDMSLIPNGSTITNLNDGTISVSNYYNNTYVTLGTLAPGLKVGMKAVLDLDTDGVTFIYLSKYSRVWDKGGVLEITQRILDSQVVIYGKAGQTDGSSIIRSIQIRLVDCDTVIEPYSGTQTFSVPYTLRGIPVSNNGNYTDSNGQQWYCDEIDFDRQVLIQRCFLETLTFTLQTELDRYSATILNRANANVAVDQGIPVVCNALKFDANAGSGTPKVNGIRIAASSPTYAIAYYNGEVISEATVLYPLETPIETELTADDITAYKALYTNKPNTVILNDANTYMHLDYNVDTEMYIDAEIESALNNNIQNVLYYVGTTLTPISNGSTNKNIIVGGSMVSAKTGMIAKYNNVTYWFDGSTWCTL